MEILLHIQVARYFIGNTLFMFYMILYAFVTDNANNTSHDQLQREIKKKNKKECPTLSSSGEKLYLSFIFASNLYTLKLQ